MGISITKCDIYRKSGSPSKNMTLDFALDKQVSSHGKYPKSSPKLQNTPKCDLENDASRYARNFVIFVGNRGRQARI